MASCPDLLAVAVDETVRMSRAPFEEWRKEGALFGPGVPAGDGSGSYRSSQAAMDALAQIADIALDNDAALKRVVATDAARMAASRTLGDLLPELAAGTDLDENWRKFRDRLRERLDAAKVKLTHYHPVWMFAPKGVSPFTVGPVEFLCRDQWLRAVERRRGVRSSWMDGVEDIWSGRKTTEQTTDPTAVGLARAVHPDQWVACVAVAGFEPEESRRRALAATRAALDVMRLVVPAPENAKIRAAVDHAPPFAVDRLSQLDGGDLMRGSGFNWPSLRGRPEDAQSLLNSAVDLRRAAGARIALYLRPEPTAPAGCPKLSDRWVNALHWYGLGCSVDADFNAIVNFVVALDVLSGGREESGIRRLAARLFRMAEDDPILSTGTRLKKLVERLYGYRSEIAHGSVLGLDERLRDDRGWAERLAAFMLIAYVLELEKYAAAGKADDRDAFFAALPPPPASAVAAPAGSP